jgi:predicted transcriptional regulator
MDLPVWQALYTELSDTNFLPITVAFESRGPEAARPWIEAAKPTHPSLIDEHHVVADLYGMVNVPIAVWINEEGRIVRPPEPAGSSDSFREMDRTKFTMPEDALKRSQESRRAYLAALRDWARNGDRSRFALSEDEVLKRMEPYRDETALAHAHFRLGEHLVRTGSTDAGQRHLAEAARLRPESWAMKRQAWDLDAVGKSGGPEFWAAVDALGADRYYADVPDIVPARG